MRSLVFALLLAWPAQAAAQQSLTEEATPQPVHLEASWTVTDGSFRPVPLRIDPSQSVDSVGAGVRIAPGIELSAEALVAQPMGQGDVRAVAGRAGADVAIGSHVVVTGAFLRELGGDSGGYVETRAFYGVGRLELSALGHLECVFGPGRDPVDLVAVARASWRVAAPLRIGVEYVGQDLEEAFDDERAEGGPRHYVGPTVAVALGPLLFVTDAAVGIATGQPSPLVARGSLAFTY